MWPAKRLKTVALRAVLRGKCDEHSAMVITGSPRSGTTWLGTIIAHLPEASVLFEPCMLERVPAAKRAGFTWRTYVNPTREWPAGASFLRRAFRGEILNEWTTQEMSLKRALRTRCLVVKFVRLNRLLPWMGEHLSLRAPILILRHPCAVLASQLGYGRVWARASRPEVPEVLADYPALQPHLEDLRDTDDFLATQWALDAFIPLASVLPRRFQIVTYEQLVREPEPQLHRLFGGWNMAVPPRVLDDVARPSRTTNAAGMSGLAGWRKQLSRARIERILEITARFGLDFYSDALEPDHDRLFASDLPQRLTRLGGGAVVGDRAPAQVALG